MDKVWIIHEQMNDCDDIITVFSSEEECRYAFDFIKQDYLAHDWVIDNEWENCFRVEDRSWVYMIEKPVRDTEKHYVLENVLHFNSLQE